MSRYEAQRCSRAFSHSHVHTHRTARLHAQDGLVASETPSLHPPQEVASHSAVADPASLPGDRLRGSWPPHPKHAQQGPDSCSYFVATLSRRLKLHDEGGCGVNYCLIRARVSDSTSSTAYGLMWTVWGWASERPGALGPPALSAPLCVRRWTRGPPAHGQARAERHTHEVASAQAPRHGAPRLLVRALR